ncbi:MAG: dockerin type I domain-containing protein, partial [Planctomycetota bacterium]
MAGIRAPWGATAFLAAGVAAAGAHAGGISSLVGLDALAERIGAENVPTGLDVIVGQVEVPAGPGSANYGPNQGHAEFDTKTFIDHSGPPGNSAHATTVGRHMYGLATSIAPDVAVIHLWEANSWLGAGFLRTTLGGQPLPTPAGVRLLNCSWVGDAGASAVNNEILRRADYVTVRDDVLLTVGVNNGPPNVPLMSHIYNGLSVGVMNGSHLSDATLAGIDGPGRQKPEIVAPTSLTSFSAPIVAAAAALMIETARSLPGLVGNPNAERVQVVKAVLLAGANHRAGWTNNPATSGPTRGITAQPLDTVYGADLVNVNNSHLILSGDEQDGATTPPDAANASHAGWDYASVGLNQSLYWRFDVLEEAAQVSILTTWPRLTNGTFTASLVADFDLTLWRVDESGALVTLVGDAGVDYFSGGNVVSQSIIDNVEHLFVRDLAPGEYVLELERLDNLTTHPLWNVALAWRLPVPPCLLADVNGDGAVNVLDLIELLLCFGLPADPPCDAPDVNGDGTVNVLDLIEVLLDFGLTCTPILPPRNDACADSIAIFDGLTPFDTLGSTTDGLPTNGVGFF